MSRSGFRRAPTGSRLRTRAVVAGLVVAAGLGTVALIALGPDGSDSDQAREHATAACDLVVRAGEAASVDTAARYAAAALLLDEAVIVSGRAARAAPEFSALSSAVQAVHDAAHQGDPGPWREALDTALATCREARLR